MGTVDSGNNVKDVGEKKKSHYLKVGKMSAIEYPSRWPSTPSPPTKHTAITKEVNLIMNNKMAI